MESTTEDTERASLLRVLCGVSLRSGSAVVPDGLASYDANRRDGSRSGFEVVDEGGTLEVAAPRLHHDEVSGSARASGHDLRERPDAHVGPSGELEDVFQRGAPSDLALHGHTHRHRFEHHGGRLVFNPGECAGHVAGLNAVGVVDLTTLEATLLRF